MAIKRYKGGKLLKPTEKLKAEKKSARGGFTAGKYKTAGERRQTKMADARGGFTAGKYKTAAERRTARKGIKPETKAVKKIKAKQGLSWTNSICSGGSFSACFKSAREKKKSTFTWNGKSYAVALKEKK